MKERGLTVDNVVEAILSLTPNDSPKGPQSDRNGYEGFIYTFKSNYLADEVIYIKIRYNPPDEVVCISFHEDEI